MAVLSETSDVEYAGNDVALVFPVPFVYLDVGHVVVTRTVADLAHVLTLGVDYTLTPARAPSGGTVTLVEPLATGATLHIGRVVPLTQSAQLRTAGPFSPATIEDALDLGVMRAQQEERERVWFEERTSTLEGRADDMDERAGSLDFRATSLEGRTTTLEGLQTGLGTRTSTVEGRTTAVEGRATSLEGRATSLEAAVVAPVSVRLATASGGTTDRTIAAHFADQVTPADFGAPTDGVTDASTALSLAAASGRPIAIERDYVVALPVTLGAARLVGRGGRLIVTTSSLTVFTIASGFTADGLVIECRTLYSNAVQNTQRIFVAPARATGVMLSDISAYAYPADDTGATRAGELVNGYFAQSTFSNLNTQGLRNGVVSDGEDISGLTISGCTFRNAERGIYLTGLNPHLNNPLVSRGFVLADNALINTATQGGAYYAIEGRELYNLQNIGSVVISNLLCEYAAERAFYGICVEDVSIVGAQIRGTEGIKFSGDQWDLSGTGGSVVNKKSKGISITGVHFGTAKGNSYAVILQVVEDVRIDGLLADGNLSLAHACVYIESYAKRVTIRNVRARDFKRGLVWFRALLDLPSAGTIPVRPSGTYAREFRDIVIEDCEGDQVCTLQTDAAYTPTRTIPFIYTLFEDNLVAALTTASRVFFDLTIRRCSVNPTSNNGAGGPRYRAPSTTKAVLDINYVQRLRVEGLTVNDLGGADFTGIKVGSASGDVIIDHVVPQATNFDTVPAIAGPLFVSVGSELRYFDTQTLGNTRINYRYRLRPQVVTGAGGSAQRAQVQDMSLIYRCLVESEAVHAAGENNFFDNVGGSGSRNYLTGVLAAGLTTSAFVLGEVWADNGEGARFVLNSPWTTPTVVQPTTNFATAFSLTTGTVSSSRVPYLVNNSGASRIVNARAEYIVQRTSVA